MWKKDRHLIQRVDVITDHPVIECLWDEASDCHVLVGFRLVSTQ